jgi:hypothetical protein
MKISSQKFKFFQTLNKLMTLGTCWVESRIKIGMNYKCYGQTGVMLEVISFQFLISCHFENVSL